MTICKPSQYLQTYTNRFATSSPWPSTGCHTSIGKHSDRSSANLLQQLCASCHALVRDNLAVLAAVPAVCFAVAPTAEGSTSAASAVPASLLRTTACAQRSHTPERRRRKPEHTSRPCRSSRSTTLSSRRSRSSSRDSSKVTTSLRTHGSDRVQAAATYLAHICHCCRTLAVAQTAESGFENRVFVCATQHPFSPD